MRDELDGELLHRFAASRRPLADEEFVAQVMRRLHSQALPGTMGSVLVGIGAGITAPLRLRYGGLLALAAGAVTLASALSGSL
jgi:hypothetical protein